MIAYYLAPIVLQVFSFFPVSCTSRYVCGPQNDPDETMIDDPESSDLRDHIVGVRVADIRSSGGEFQKSNRPTVIIKESYRWDNFDMIR